MIRTLAAVLLVIALPSAPALAGNGPALTGNGNGKGKGNGQGNSKGSGNSKHGNDGGKESWSNEHDDHDPSPRFSDSDRDGWRSYWYDEYEHGNCPPGLAKKNNGCMPPGQAKKRYRVGDRLPPDVVVLEVPGILLPRLTPLAPGYRYGMIDGDLVKLAIGTLLVVDAVEGLTSR